MVENAIYELLPMLDTPGYQCFGVTDNRPIVSGRTFLSDFCPTDVSTRDWKAPRLTPVWRPREVVNPLPTQVNDYPAIGLRVPTFSQRAVDALRDLLESNGEILPLVCESGQYYAYNVTTIADVLNRETSDIDWLPHYRLRKIEPVIAEQIRYYDFVPEQAASLVIFRIPEDMTGFYVTEIFARRVNEHGLKGFNLRKVWPLPRPKKDGFKEMERRTGTA